MTFEKQNFFLNLFKFNQQVLDTVDNEKKNLLSQLRDYEWRLEQENKVFFCQYNKFKIKSRSFFFRLRLIIKQMKNEKC